MITRWAVQWHSVNKLDGERRDLIGGLDRLFKTRKEARQYIKERYGFIQEREDLRIEPHGWKMPVAVKVVVEISIAEKNPSKRTEPANPDFE